MAALIAKPKAPKMRNILLMHNAVLMQDMLIMSLGLAILDFPGVE
jgi:hypothetical protein